MKKIKKNTLSLNTETIRVLDDAALSGAVGGWLSQLTCLTCTTPPSLGICLPGQTATCVSVDGRCTSNCPTGIC